MNPAARFFAVFAAMSFAAISGHAATIVDDFNTGHDYSTRDVTGTIWDGVMFNNGFSGTQNTTLLSANSNTSNAGRLTLSSANGDWSGNGDDGFFLFRQVSGDFSATIQVISANKVDYHGLGLMARAANAADGGAGEDYVAGRYYVAGTLESLRNVDDGAETDTDVAGLRSFLKLERTGNLFTYTRAADSAFTLNVVTSSVLRNDLDGLPLQVGIWQATFSGSTGTAALDNFSLTTNPIPEPSSCMLGCFGATVFLRRRLR